MNTKSKLPTTIFFALIYFFLAIYNYYNGSEWFNDSILALFLLGLTFYYSDYLKMTKDCYILFNMGLLAHNLGSFGFYSYTFSIFAYDNLVHLLNSMVWAYIIFNFITRKFDVKKNERVKNSFIGEHISLIILLVISLVSMCGVIIELIEFTGYSYLGAGDGMFFTGVGDSNQNSEISGLYIDTMGDIFINIIGAIIGTFLYYRVKSKKNLWLNY